MGFHRIQIEPTWLREFCLYTDMPNKAGEPPFASGLVVQVLRHERRVSVPQQWLPQRMLHLAKGEAFKARSEKREPPSTKE